MFYKFLKYATATVLTLLLSLFLFGCGGGGTAAPGPTPTPAGGFTVTGKVSLADGTLINGATVSLHKTSYAIYSTASAKGHLYGTVNLSVDPVALQSKSTVNGVYVFTGVQSGSYTIQPASNLYVFKWFHVPTLGTIGVVSITESGMVYVYNPEGTGNILLADGTNGAIIYNNAVPPFALTGNGQYFDFVASLPGSGGI